MAINSLTLLAGTPIPIPELGVELHQPRLKEIAVLGEDNFYQALAILTTKKETYLAEMEKRFQKEPETFKAIQERISFLSDFQLVLHLLDANEESSLVIKSFFYTVFPTLGKCFIDDMAMILSFKDGIDENGKIKYKQVIVSEQQFLALSGIVEELFASEEMNKQAFNPANDKAAQIAAKIEARRAKVASEKGLDKNKNSMIATSISILSSIAYIPLETLLNYTLPQLSYQLERSKELVSYETQMTLGAFSGLKDIEIADWSKPI